MLITHTHMTPLFLLQLSRSSAISEAAHTEYSGSEWALNHRSRCPLELLLQPPLNRPWVLRNPITPTRSCLLQYSSQTPVKFGSARCRAQRIGSNLTGLMTSDLTYRKPIYKAILTTTDHWCLNSTRLILDVILDYSPACRYAVVVHQFVSQSRC